MHERSAAARNPLSDASVAPNGRAVRDNFAAWAGGKCLLDAEGIPQVLYHGTASRFDAFRGPVTWVSGSPRLAAQYASYRAEEERTTKAMLERDAGQRLAQVLPLYVRCGQPFRTDNERARTVGTLFAEMLAQSGAAQLASGLAGIDEPTLAQVEQLRRVVLAGAQLEESGPHYNTHDFWNEPEMRFGRAGAAAIIETLVLLGFDAICYPEQDSITYGVIHAAGAEPVARQADGDAFFQQGLLDAAADQQPGSRDLLVHLAPEDFLAVAMSGHAPEKDAVVASLLEQGVQLNTLPCLNFVHSGEGVATVTGHEGRHRARALQRMGVTRMPVLLCHRYDENGQALCWGEIAAEPRRFVDTWPAVLYGERGDSDATNRNRNNAIPFPVPDLRMVAGRIPAPGSAALKSATGNCGNYSCNSADLLDRARQQHAGHELAAGPALEQERPECSRQHRSPSPAARR